MTPILTAEVKMLCATQQQLQRRLCSQAVKPRTTVTLVRAMADSTKTAATDLKNAGPEPKKFGVADGYLGSVVGASFGPLLRFGTGALASGYKAEFVADDGSSSGTYTLATVGGRRLKETSKVTGFKRPEKPLVLYEFQGCPFCKKVREAVSVLDLDVEVRPCPKGGSVWRNKVVEMGGKAQFPFLVDPNTDQQMYESDAIITYLFNEYGDGEVPLPLRMGFLTTLTAGLALAPRAGKGSQVRANKQPAQQLVLWGYDASPFVNLVKEALSELELPYKQVTCSRGSPKRQELLDKRGHFQVPYLEDPNQGVYLFESSAIVKYLEDTYASASSS